MQQILKYKHIVLLGIILVFHTVGIIGLSSDSRTYFLSLSPLNLLLSVACLLLSYTTISRKLLVDLCLVACLGFTVEWIGVHTGYLFGDYTYGANLGWKVDGIPVMIAVNWVMLCFSSIALSMRFNAAIFMKALLSAAFMLILDFLIEPVAVKSDFWTWTNGSIPIFNYVCWFLIALPINFYLLKRKTVEQNSVAIGLFLTLIVFFGILNVM